MTSHDLGWTAPFRWNHSTGSHVRYLFSETRWANQCSLNVTPKAPETFDRPFESSRRLWIVLSENSAFNSPLMNYCCVDFLTRGRVYNKSIVVSSGKYEAMTIQLESCSDIAIRSILFSNEHEILKILSVSGPATIDYTCSVLSTILRRRDHR